KRGHYSPDVTGSGMAKQPRSDLLGVADIRLLANRIGLRPTKALGQNFVHDANTIRRITRIADLAPGEVVLEVGPGLGWWPSRSTSVSRRYCRRRSGSAHPVWRMI